MKPFDLQAAIARAPIQLKTGGSLKFIAYAPEAGSYQKVIVMDSEGDISVHPSNPSEIVMTPVFKKYWVNVYNSESGAPYFGVPYDNEADAMSYVVGVDGYGYLKTISFDIEE